MKLKSSQPIDLQSSPPSSTETEKISDIIFIEEPSKINLLNNKKKLNEPKHHQHYHNHHIHFQQLQQQQQQQQQQHYQNLPIISSLNDFGTLALVANGNSSHQQTVNDTPTTTTTTNTSNTTNNTSNYSSNINNHTNLSLNHNNTNSNNNFNSNSYIRKINSNSNNNNFTTPLSSSSTKQKFNQLLNQHQYKLDVGEPIDLSTDNFISSNNNFKSTKQHAKLILNSNQLQRNSNLNRINSSSNNRLSSPNGIIGYNYLNSSSIDLTFNSYNSLNNSSNYMVINKLQDQQQQQTSPMTQFTKYTKNIYTENYNNGTNANITKSNINGSNTSLNNAALLLSTSSNNSPANQQHYKHHHHQLHSSHHHNAKSPSRVSNQTAVGASGGGGGGGGGTGTTNTPVGTLNGSPLSLINSSSMPKPVMITNFNPTNFGTINHKNDRIKSSSISRSVTMKYTKPQFDPNLNTTNNTNVISNNTGSNTQQQQQQQQQQQHQQGSNLHSRKSFHQTPSSTPLQHQQQLILDPSIGNQQTNKKDFLSVLSNIHRSSSIKLNREKTSLTNYFSTLAQNRDRQLSESTNMGSNGNLTNNNNNSFINNSNLTLNIISTSNNFNASSNTSSRFGAAGTATTKKQSQPFSLRNNPNSNTNNNNNSVNPNSNKQLIEQTQKNSISLDNVFNNLDYMLSSSNDIPTFTTKYGQPSQSNALKYDMFAPGSSSGITAVSTTGTTAAALASNLINNNYTFRSNPGAQSGTGPSGLNAISVAPSASFNTNASKNKSNSQLLNRNKRSQKLEQQPTISSNVGGGSGVQHFGNDNLLQVANDESVEIKELTSNNNHHTANNYQQRYDKTKQNGTVNTNNNLMNLVKEEPEPTNLQMNGHDHDDEDGEDDEEDQIAAINDENYQHEFDNQNFIIIDDNNYENNNEYGDGNLDGNGVRKRDSFTKTKSLTLESKLSNNKIDEHLNNGMRSNRLDPPDQLKKTSRTSGALGINLNKQIIPGKPVATPINNNQQIMNQRQKNSLEISQQVRTTNNNNNNPNDNANSAELQPRNTNISNNSNSNSNRAKVVRANSKLSHVTRDVNDSYAYTNVQQYIEENDLMPPEKSHSIRKWIREVNSWCEEWEKRTIELNIQDS